MILVNPTRDQALELDKIGEEELEMVILTPMRSCNPLLQWSPHEILMEVA